MTGYDTKMVRGSGDPPRNLRHEKALDVRSITLVNAEIIKVH